jgi:hypothetical protein
MFKDNSIILVFAVIVFLVIILVSTISSVIKILSILLSVAFLLPAFRKKVFTNDLFLRKLKVSLQTAFVFTAGLLLIALPSIFAEKALTNDLIPGLIFTFGISLIVILVYGLPVSLLAEVISSRVPNNRAWVSGVIHVGFGLLTSLISLSFGLVAAICAILFFLHDESVRGNDSIFYKIKTLFGKRPG